MISRFFALVIVASLCIVPSAPAQVAPADSSRVVLAPGDVIRITVWRNPDLTGEFPIAADGSITHPLYRELKVAGLPMPLVEDRIRAFLNRYEANPTFVLFPLIRVIVGGEVRQPNIIAVPPGTTVAQAIAMAGGPTERARLDRVRVIREQGSFELDLRQPEASATRSELHSRDEIVVPRRRNVLQDYIVPSSSILAGVAALATLIIQLK